MTVSIVLFVIVIPSLLFFVWSNYSHLSKLRKLEEGLSESKLLCENSKLLLAEAKQQLNLDMSKVMELENQIVSKQLALEQVKQDKFLVTLKNLSRPSNKDLGEQDAPVVKYTDFIFPVLDPKVNRPELPGN